MDYILLVLLLAVCFSNSVLVRIKSIIMVIALLTFAFWFISDMFTGNGVNDAVYYHLKSNVHGTSIDDILPKEGANKQGNSSRLTQSFHFFMFEPIFSPVNALNQPI
jgi:hypothetical protein